MTARLLVAVAALGGILCAQDPDSDGDGLSDLAEIHKYRTDPKRADSDGDGRRDGEWNERREHTYSVRAVVRVMRSYDLATMNDDYQDVRVRSEADDWVEIEAIVYPLNTWHAAVRANRDWRKIVDEGAAAHLRPGPTTNWDDDMRTDVLLELKRAKIDLDSLTDAAAARRVADWALRRAKALEMFTTYCVDFADDKPAVHPDLTEKFERCKGDAKISTAAQFQREILGAGCYWNRTRGTCTSSANYLTTVLRAAGLPTRMIICVPIVDASDPKNADMVSRLRHHGVRDALEHAVDQLGNSFAAHTYNEVLIGGRWVRLNYGKLAQNVLDKNYMGLMLRVHTFGDLSEAGLARGWGTRKQRAREVFRHNNPYTCVELSDRFGAHARMTNPEVASTRHRELTITRSYWFHSSGRPRGIGADWKTAGDPKHGHLMVHVKEHHPRENVNQYSRFFRRSDAEFELHADGEPPVRAVALHCIWAGTAHDDGAEIYVRIHTDDFAKMKAKKEYRIVPRNGRTGYRWNVAGDVRIVRK